jgi:F-type H+-transporting ATPase subunit gamma
VEASQPYADAITRAVSAVATQSSTEHPLTTAKENPRRAAMLLITSDRGLAGAYNANALRTGEELAELLRNENKEPVPYLIGRKAANFYRFRQREAAGEWSGFSEQPQYENAKEVADELINAFLQDTDEGGVDEIHMVFTEFRSALVQRPKAVRVLPLAVVEAEEPPDEGPLPLYEFEPSGEAVLDALLPRYVESRVYAALLQSAASESAARRRAMKAATDNAEELIRTYTRLANAARQAEITQEISEIVGGADALAATGSDDY